MTTTQVNPRFAKNGDSKAPEVKTIKRRVRKPLTVKTAGLKISALLDTLPDQLSKTQAIAVAKALSGLT
jgi:hypothetical protein